jgi:hypothetical protein
MAFAISGFQPAAGLSKANAAPAIHTYRTADSIATVMAAGYFAAIQTLIRKGDLVVVHADTGGSDTVHLIRCSVTGANIAFSMPNVGSVAGQQLLVRELALPVTAVLTTDFTLAVPPGFKLLRATTFTSLAYTGNTVTLALGTTVGGAEIVAAVSIKSLGVVAHTLLPAAAFPVVGGLVTARVTQTATATVVGTGTVVLEGIAA